MAHCECTLSVMPIDGGTYARPSLNCPIHKTLAERWDKIDSWRDFYEALKADNPNIPSFEEWMKHGNLTE